MTEQVPEPERETPTVHLSQELRDLVSNGKHLPPTFDQDILARLFESIRLYDAPVASAQFPEAGRKRKGVEGLWLIILTGALFALNAVEAIPILYRYAITQAGGSEDKMLFVAGRMREVGLKSVSFMGVPRAINCLGALTVAISKQTPRLKGSLPRESRRRLTPENMEAVQVRGRQLWDDIYAPHHEKLLSILGRSHPDLPTHIIQCHYSALLSPFPPEMGLPTDLDRVESSVVAVTCLRALGGVDKQVESHVFGLRKARTDEWIATDDGCVWLLGVIDGIVDVCGGVSRS